MYDPNDPLWKHVEIAAMPTLFKEAEAEIAPYLEFIHLHKSLGRFNPGSLMVPISSIQDPEVFYENTGSRKRNRPCFNTDYEKYWEMLIVAGTVKVVSLLPKMTMGPMPALRKILSIAEQELGIPLSLDKGAFLSTVEPYFAWPLHIDGSPRRVHLPVVTNSYSGFVWGDRVDGNSYSSVLQMKLGELYMVRTDIPHTIFNYSHRTRIHLILDSREDIHEIFEKAAATS